MTRDPGIIKPHTNCKCGTRGVVILIQVFHTPSGKVRVGAFSEFGSVGLRTKRLILSDNYQFKRWIVECADCMHNDTQKEMFG